MSQAVQYHLWFISFRPSCKKHRATFIFLILANRAYPLCYQGVATKKMISGLVFSVSLFTFTAMSEGSSTTPKPEYGLLNPAQWRRGVLCHFLITNNPIMTKNAVLVHPDDIARAALRVKLETRYPCLRIVSEAADSTRGEALVQQLKPDFAFVEARLLEGDDLPARRVFKGKPSRLSLPGAELAVFSLRGDNLSSLDRPHEPKRPDSPSSAGALQPLSNLPAKPAGPCTKEMEQWLERRFALRHAKGVTFFALKELIRIEADYRKTRLYLTGRPEYVISQLGINRVEEVLGGIPFLFRSHRSHLVNLFHLKEYQKAAGLLILSSHNGENGTKAVLTDDRRAALRKALEKLGWRDIGGRDGMAGEGVQAV